MHAKMRLAGWWLLFEASCAGDILGQEPTPRERFDATRAELVAAARAQLQASTACENAWSAHAVAEYRLRECIPEVRACLAASAKGAGPEPAAKVLACLDALVENRADVPGSELAPFLDGCDAHVDLGQLLFLTILANTGAPEMRWNWTAPASANGLQLYLQGATFTPNVHDATGWLLSNAVCASIGP